MKYRNTVMTLALFGVVTMMAGCGQSVDDNFTFGSGRIFCANRVLTVEAPFPFGVKGKMSESAARDVSSVEAEGHNRYTQILVMGDAGKTDSKAKADEALTKLKMNPYVSDLVSSEDAVTVDGSPAVKLTVSFTDTERGKRTPLSVEEYIFEKDGVLWRVVYQYLTGDETGRELVSRVSGKIRFGSHF